MRYMYVRVYVCCIAVARWLPLYYCCVYTEIGCVASHFNRSTHVRFALLYSTLHCSLLLLPLSPLSSLSSLPSSVTPHALLLSCSAAVSVLLSLYAAGAGAFRKRAQSNRITVTNNAIRCAHHITPNIAYV